MMTWILEFLHHAFSMPTAIFSVLLILVILYWLSVILGLDFGLFEGLSDAAEGMTEGVLEGTFDAAEGAFDAVDAADGAAEGGAEPTLFENLGIAEVPRTVLFSLLIFFGWLFTYLGMRLAPGMTSAAFHGLWLAVAVVAGALVLSFVATLIALRPLARILVTPTPLGRRDLVGRLCTVITLRVDEKFGQAEIDHLPIQVEARAAAPNALRRGSRALVFDYDESREVFLIAPLAEELTEPSS